MTRPQNPPILRDEFDRAWDAIRHADSGRERGADQSMAIGRQFHPAGLYGRSGDNALPVRPETQG